MNTRKLYIAIMASITALGVWLVCTIGVVAQDASSEAQTPGWTKALVSNNLKPAIEVGATATPTTCPPGSLYQESEPNNTIAQANQLGDKRMPEVRGGITPAGDQDFFSFSANAGDRIWSYINTSNAAPSTDSILTLFNALTGTIQLDDDNGFQSTLSSAMAGGVITQTGTHALAVRQFGGATIMSPYSLYIDRTSGAAIPEVEPNNVFTQANTYNFGTVVTGSIPISTDLDYFVFTLALNDKIVIQVDGDPDRNGTNLSRVNQFNPNFDLLDANGALITAVDSDSQGGNGGLLSENLVFTNTSILSTTFGVRVKFDPSTPVEDDLGIYNLHIYEVGGAGCLGVTPTVGATNTVIAPTNTVVPPTGTPIVPSATPIIISTNTPAGATNTAVASVTSVVSTTTPTRIPTLTATPPLVATATYTLTPTSTPICTIEFTDVLPGSTFYAFIHCLACRGIVGGYDDGTFRPNNPVTRGQLTKIVSNAAGFNETQTGQSFQDVPVGSTFHDYVQRLADRNVIGGYPCGGPGEPCVPPNNSPYFRPGNPVTRGQAAKIIGEGAGYAFLPEGQLFQDVPPGSTFYDYVQRLGTQGAFSGYPCGGSGELCVPPDNRPYFRPGNGATRGQISKIAANAFYIACADPCDPVPGIPSSITTDGLPVNNVPGAGGGWSYPDMVYCTVCQDSATSALTTQDYGNSVNLANGGVYASTQALGISGLTIPGQGLDFNPSTMNISNMEFDSVFGVNTIGNYEHTMIVPVNPETDCYLEQSLGTSLGMGDTVIFGARPYVISANKGSGASPAFAPYPGFEVKVTKIPSGYELWKNGLKGTFDQVADYGSNGLGSVAHLSRLEDRHGNVMRFEYGDVQGQLRLARVYDTYGRLITYHYDGQSRLSYIEDFMGRRVTYSYDANGDLVAITSASVVNTPNGNDFPNGKTWRFTYSSGYSDPKLNHNLLTITRPSEVALGGPPSEVFTYDSQDRVRTHTIGGTNRFGIPAGGTTTYNYTALAHSHSGDPNEAVSQTEVTDRNGNRTVYQFNAAGNIVAVQEYTNRDIRPGDPEFYETSFEYDNASEVTRRINPMGNEVRYVYDEGNLDPLQHGNLLSETRYADATRGGDQATITTARTYEPIYNQVHTMTEARGNDHTYIPQNGGQWSAQRYRTVYTFDYQEGNNAAALAARLGLSEQQVVNRLAAAGVPMNLGDINGDGVTNGIAGDVIRIQRPSVNLLPGSNMAQIEQSTVQPIVTLFTHNSHGQVVKEVDEEGNVTQYEYYPENDPDGDGLNITPGVGSGPYGYLKLVRRDTTSNPLRDSRTNPSPVNINTRYYYDRVGNVTGELDGRGILTKFSVNQLNQVVQIERAYNVDAARINPEEPNWVACTDPTLRECTDGMVVFAYKERIFYGYNDEVVLRQVEDRGNTSGVDGNLPPQDLPANVPNPDPAGGVAYVDTAYKYDILNHQVEMVTEVKHGTGAEFIRSQTRYDRNENRVLEISPMAIIQGPGGQPSNVQSWVYDERDLLYTSTRGGLTAQFRSLPAHADIPERLTIPDSADISTFSRQYDHNRNLKISTDGADNTGNGQPEPTTYLYDGFDRQVSVIDAISNQSYIQYDPAGNVVHMYQFGPVGGPSPSNNSAANFSQPLHLQDFTQQMLSHTLHKVEELSRVFETGDQLYAYPGVVYQRAPVLRDGPLGVPYDGWVTTRYEYDRKSRQTFTILDNLSTSRTFYDGVDRAIEQRDPEGNRVLTSYDDDGNATQFTQIEVTQSGHVPTIQETFVTINVYDALNRLIRTTDNIGQTSRSHYDSRSNLVYTSDAQHSQNPSDLIADPLGLYPVPGQSEPHINLPGNTVAYVYDGQSRQIAEVRHLRVDGQGANAIDTGNPANPDGLIVMDQDWDANSRLVARADDGSTVGDQNTSIGVIEPVNPLGNVTHYTYDDLDRLGVERFDDGETNTYTYDADDNQRTMVDPNVSIMTYTYDGINRLITNSVSRGPNVVGTTLQTFQYDGLSRPTQSFDNNDAGTANDAVVTYAYDSLSRLLEEVQSGTPVSSRWDGVSNRLGLVYPNNRVVNTTYDASNRTDTIKIEGEATNIANYDYIGPARVLQRANQNGTRLTYLDDAGLADVGYDDLGRPVQMRHLRTNNSLVVGFEHTYDLMDNKLTERKLHQVANSEQYTYDSAYRLVDFQRGPVSANDGASKPSSPNTLDREQWTLDGVGNWPAQTLTLNGTPVVETREHSTLNELTEIARAGGTPTPIAYDDNGNQTEIGNPTVDGSYLYKWDFSNRLREVRQVIGGQPTLIAVYTYDAADRRVQKVVTNTPGQNGTTRFYLDGWQEIEERDGGGTLLRQIVYGIYIDEPLVLDRFNPSQPRIFYHQNTLGSAHALTDPAALIKEGYHYDAYGQQTVYQPGPNGQVDWGGDDVITPGGPSVLGNPYLYTGRRLDTETGLYYYRMRYMNGEQGRFVQRDPLGYVDGMNLYEYVSSNSVNKIDPLGLTDYQECLQRSSWYCNAAQKYPKNTWLKCVCDVSKKICNWAFSPQLTNRAKISWFLQMNECIAEFWVQGMKEMYNDGTYTKLPRKKDREVTDEWKDAAKICKDKGDDNQECCEAMVKAEQAALEKCKNVKFSATGNLIGEYLTEDWGGPFEVAGRDLSGIAGVPAFEGDFNSLANRVKYGIKKCCPTQSPTSRKCSE
jgi:RHS repeat-associated protein